MKRTEIKQVTMTPNEGVVVEKNAKLAGITVSTYIRKILNEHLIGLKPISYDGTEFVLNTLKNAEFEEITDSYETLEGVCIKYVHKEFGAGYEFNFDFDGNQLIYKSSKFIHSCDDIVFDYEKVILAVSEIYQEKMVKNESN